MQSLDEREPAGVSERAERPWDSETWFQQEYPRLVRFAIAVAGDEQVAEDVVMEAFLRIEQSDTAIEDADAYIRRIIVNLSRSRFRRLRVERSFLERSHDRQEHLEAPSERDLAVWECLQRLSARQRAVIALRYHEDLTDEQIAATLGISAGSVRTHLFRAIQRLRTLLTEDER